MAKHPDLSSQSPEIVVPDHLDLQDGDVPAQFTESPDLVLPGPVEIDAERKMMVRVTAPPGEKWRVAAELVPLLVPISSTTPDPVNARAHPDRNIASIRGSFRRHGQLKPLVLDKDGVIAAGNGTREALLAEGWTHVAVVHTDLSGAEAMAFALADNRTAELAAWRDETLQEHLRGLKSDAPQLIEDLWTPKELAKLLGEEGEGGGGGEMPTLQQTWSVLIECDTEQQQVELLEELLKRGLRVKALMT